MMKLKKKISEKNQSQPMLTFETCDFSHELGTNPIKGKP
jgi:hypothetical protein